MAAATVAPSEDAPGPQLDPPLLDISSLTVAEQWHAVYRSQFRNFLQSFGRPSEAEAETSPWSVYERQAIDIARQGIDCLAIRLRDVVDWPQGLELAAFIKRCFLPLRRLLDATVNHFVHAVLHRYTTQDRSEGEGSGLSENFASREFYCRFKYDGASVNVRGLRCELLGQLINLRGTATRLSDIRPELRSATFECGMCRALIPNVEQHFKFTEPNKCVNAECKNRHAWRLKYETCRFSDWQKLKLQENSAEIPAGSMPRSMDVILCRGVCDACKPGDKLVIAGCLAAIPDVTALMKPGEVPRSVAMDRNRLLRTEYGLQDNAVSGLRKFGARDLGYKIVFFAQDVVLDVSSETAGVLLDKGGWDQEPSITTATSLVTEAESLEKVMNILGLTESQRTLFLSIARSPDALSKLADCVAPEIFGCQSIKKGVLLMIVGGVEKLTGADGLKLRGDINMCIVGDPGTAKSQLLKYVRQFAPRAVYTAGNTSTAAGLTVSVLRDPDQGGDSVIEAGALMLADRGVCCIDEFEKMKLKDMIAIHEAMEQQTISVCKGGVQATLNARASILAACNPRNSRYDLSKPFRHNVRLSAPIISRFDLFFVLLDSPDNDAAVAWHIVNLHSEAGSTGDPEAAEAVTQETGGGMLSRDLLRKYLMLARSRKPQMTQQAREVLVRAYVGLRAETAAPGGAKSASVTVRSLESLIRMSEAIAKLRLTESVQADHVEEALLLMQTALLKLDRGSVVLDQAEGEGAQGVGDPTAEGGGVTSTKKLVIDADEFERITASLINRLRDVEIEQAALATTEKDRIPEAILAKDDLITWYLETCGAASMDTTDPQASSEEAVISAYAKIEKVIDRMVNCDMSLIEEDRDMEFTLEDGTKEVRRVPAVRLHPNYCADDGGLGVARREVPTHRAGEAAHATLPTEFFTATAPSDPATSAESGHETGPSLLDDDDDFMGFMYGWNK